MTFREKLALEHSEYVSESFTGGCRHCPVDYGYEHVLPDDCTEMSCRECWDREIPTEQPTNKCLTRAEILEAAAKIVSGHRVDDYGSPEDNFATIALLWDTYIAANCLKNDNLTITAQDVAAMLILLKIGRLGSGAGSADCWIDIAGYAACGGEIAMNGGE